MAGISLQDLVPRVVVLFVATRLYVRKKITLLAFPLGKALRLALLGTSIMLFVAVFHLLFTTALRETQD